MISIVHTFDDNERSYMMGQDETPLRHLPFLCQTVNRNCLQVITKVLSEGIEEPSRRARQRVALRNRSR